MNSDLFRPVLKSLGQRLKILIPVPDVCLKTEVDEVGRIYSELVFDAPIDMADFDPKVGVKIYEIAYP